MAERKFVKRKIFVSKRIQGLFALYVILSLFVIVFFLGAEFFLSLTEFFGIDTSTAAFSFLHTTAVAKVILIVGWGLLCYSVGVLIEQNKMAGPMVNFRRSLGKLIEGDYSVRIRLRKNDYFQEIASNINDLVSGFNESNVEDVQQLNVLMQKVQAASRSVNDDGITVEVKKTVDEVESLLRQFRDKKKSLT